MKPVLDSTLFGTNVLKKPVARQGRLAYRTIKYAFHLREIVRTRDKVFQNCLEKVRAPTAQVDEYAYYQRRHISYLTRAEVSRFED